MGLIRRVSNGLALAVALFLNIDKMKWMRCKRQRGTVGVVWDMVQLPCITVTKTQRPEFRKELLATCGRLSRRVVAWLAWAINLGICCSHTKGRWMGDIRVWQKGGV